MTSADVVGLQFAPGADGRRSSGDAARAVLGAALAAAAVPEAAPAAGAWRRGYPEAIVRLVAATAADGRAAVSAARAGLEAAYGALRWVDAGTGPQGRPLHDWAEAGDGGAARFASHEIVGRGIDAPAPWEVPYRGRMLSGDALRRQLDAWVDAGIIEPSAGVAFARCLAHPEWFDLSDRTLVLLGAGSEAGPLGWLARWRARIVAVDLPHPEVWRRIARVVEAGNARCTVPLRRGPAAGDDWTVDAGADLLAEAPAVRRWLETFDGPLDIAAHAYADGERHVRVVLAMDLVQSLALERPGSSLAFLATPTDVFAVPATTADLARRRWRDRDLLRRALQAPVRALSAGRFFLPNVEARVRDGTGQERGIVDSLVLEQGPNYALAKRLQQWRALVARDRGRRVSLNVAPSTMTTSVIAHPALAAGFAGAHLFGVEAFAPETTNALTAALWVHDLRSTGTAADPSQPLGHPLDLLSEAACHGGLWTCAYRPRSALVFAAAAGWLRRPRPVPRS